MLLSENKEKKLEEISNPPINLPSNFQMPTNYEDLCQLLEHNHQHHFKSINEMCYGCDKFNNNKNVLSEQNETLNEKIEHIQPQNHEHLCSLHALQFYPCLEDNMDIIGELNTYANLDENNNEKGINENKFNVNNIDNTNLISKSNIVNDLIQQNVAINNVNQSNSTYLTNNIQPKSSYIDSNSSQSIIFHSDFNNNNNSNNLLIQNGQINNSNENSDSSEQLINNLLENQNNEMKTVYDVLNTIPILNDQKVNQQITVEQKTYTEPLNSLSATSLEKQTTANNLKSIYEMLNIKNINDNQISTNPTTEVNNLNTFPTTRSMMNNDKITTSLPTIYTKSNSVPIYSHKDPKLSSLEKSEIKSELTSSPNQIDISTTSVLNNSLLNQSIINATNSHSNIIYPPITTPLNTTSFSNTNFNTTTAANITSTLMTPLSLSNTTAITNAIPSSTLIPKNIEEKKLLNIVPKPKEIKSRFTSVARTVAPPLKVNPPKTYVKNTTIRTKSSVIDPEEKRRRNTEASARFRARKKFTEIMLKQQTHDLSCKCCELEKELAEAKREIYWLKQLLIAKQS
ncbi:hypothetical protein H8356DRAFT_1316585 [Neocallimastix lanati (nom. inval.)]|jgi:hypothetical protein|nr:hypothetical protein H8356DRAFT_1316585 [Neocallimastix sp. JGI-2020a]